MRSLGSQCGKVLRISVVAGSVLVSGSVAAVGQQGYPPPPPDRQYNYPSYNGNQSQFRDGFRQGTGDFGRDFNGQSDDRFRDDRSPGDPRYDNHHGGIGVGGGAGIGAAGGAVLGAAFGGGIKGTLIGGAVGAGLGAAIASAAKNKDKHHDFKHR